MSTARVVKGRPLRMEDAENGYDRLLARVVIDLGELLPIDHSRYDGFSVERIGRRRVTHVTVDPGFETDWSSIPALVQSRLLLGPKRRYRFAGLGHDKAYRVGIPRGPADRVWWIIAKSGPTESEQVGPVRSWLGWAGIRLGGWWAYMRRRHEREARGAS
ncbi:MAG: DUF1353 domain-containing protein [Myxococcota bacterium]